MEKFKKEEKSSKKNNSQVTLIDRAIIEMTEKSVSNTKIGKCALK